MTGIEALLLRLEYGADTKLGRRVSDIGASFRVVEYYDALENNRKHAEELYGRLDDFEKHSVSKINQIIK